MSEHYSRELLEDFSAIYLNDETELLNSELYYENPEEPRVRLTYKCADKVVREAIFVIPALDAIIRAGVRAELKEGKL